MIVFNVVFTLLGFLCYAWGSPITISSQISGQLSRSKFVFPTNSTTTGATRTLKVAKFEQSLDNPTIESVDVVLSWEKIAQGKRLGWSFVFKKEDNVIESAVLYKPKDSSFVVRGLMDATGYTGELKMIRDQNALVNVNDTNSKTGVIFKLDSPRIISGSESITILNVLKSLPPSPIQLNTVSIGFNIPKQKDEAFLEVANLKQNTSEQIVVHIVPNTVTVIVNDLPAQTVLKMRLRSAEYKAKIMMAIYVFTGSVTKVGEKSSQISATAPRIGLFSYSARRPTVTCFVKNKAPFQGFPCHESNVCIPLHWECDGEEDCDGGFDENGCQGGLSAYTRQHVFNSNNIDKSGRCKRGEFECLRRGINVCLPSNWLCDGRTDCSNGWDEDRINCNDFKFPTSGNSYHLLYRIQCSRSQFRCRKGGCISLGLVCDNNRDCRDGSDEDDCPDDEDIDETEDTLLPDNCDPDHEYVCSGPKKKCVPRAWVCDDQEDCPDGEDESDDICNNHFHNFSD